MNYLGDFHLGQSIYFYLATFDSLGGNVAPSSAFEDADFIVYQNGNATQITAGITATSPFDAETGFHLVTIDTSNAAYSRGADYTLCLAPDETIDGQTITAAPLGHFSIENRTPGNGGFRTTIATLASQTSFTLTNGPAEDNAINGWAAVVKDATGDHQMALGGVYDYTGSTKTVTLAVDPGIFTMAVGDIVELMPIGNILSINSNAIDGGGLTAADYV